MPSRSDPGFIYFVQADPDGPVKVGWTLNVRRRLHELRGSSPLPLKLLGFIRGSKEREAGIHARFVQARSHREWFRPVPELMAFIAQAVGPRPTLETDLPKKTWKAILEPGDEDLLLGNSSPRPWGYKNRQMG